MKKKVFSLMMTLVLAFMGVARADELTVNDGTTTNGYVPVYGFYADAYLKAEYVIPAADLAEMAGAEVNGMTFYATQSSVSWGAANFQVFLTEVGSTSISAFNGPGTIVYEGALSVVDGQMVVTFTTPYQYSGGNLLVGLYNTVEGSYVTSTWYGVTADGASVQGYSYSDLASVTPTQRNFLPKTTFAYAGGGGASNGLPHVLSNGVLVDAIDLGVRPGYVNATVSPNWQGPAWMEPAKVQMYNDNNRPYTVSVLDFTPNDSLFLVLDAELPFTLAANAMDTVDLNITVRPTEAVTGTTLERQFVAIYEDTRLAAVWPITAEIYSPECPDIWELALNLHPNQMPITNQPLYESTLTGGVLHNDYNLPFDEIEEGYDAVYKLTIEQDSKLEAYVLDNYANGKVALYAEDFNGEGGPMADNYYQGIELGGGASAATPYEAMVGDEASTSTTGYFPMYYLYNYSLSTQLFMASELTEAGMTAAPMNSVSWYSESTYGYNIQNISIWMANVSDGNVNAASPLGSTMNLVYQGNFQEVVGWNEFVFNAGSFAWDGQSNILVMVQMNNGTWDSSIYWKSHNPGFQAGGYLYQDTAPYDAQNTSYNLYTTSTTRANTKFKSIGRNRDAYTYDFEGGLNGWTSIDNDGDGEGWFYSMNHYYDYTGLGHNGGDGFAVSASYDDDYGILYPDHYLVSPQKYALGTGASLDFYFDYGNDVYPDYFEVCVATAANPTAADFTAIWNVGQRGNVGQKTQIRHTNHNRYENWRNVSVDLSAYAGQEVWIAFHHEDWDMYEIWIDDVTVNTGGAPMPPTPPTPPTPGIVDNISAGPVIENLPLTPGNYYLVASSTDMDFEVYINVEPMPCPQVEGFAFNPTPNDDEDGIEPASVTLRWSIPNYATGWRIIFGSTYHPEVGHPQTIIYPEDGSFSNDMANSFTVYNLWNNTNYFWRVEFNNDQCPDGVSSPVWGFTTHLNVPQNLTVVDELVFDDEQIVLNWNAVVDRTFRTYFIYRDGVKVGETTTNSIGSTSFTDGPLDYNMAGYVYYVTAIYDEGESAPSDPITVKVSGYSNETGINGYAYEQDGETPIPGVLVTLTGTDEFGDPHTYTATTNNNGYYSKQVYAGEYTNAVATLDGYQETVTTHPLPFTVAYDAQEDNVNFIIDENFDPVCEVFAQYYPDSLDVNSPYVKVYWGCGFLPDAIIEDFETGDFSMFDWQVSANYPWSITTNNPYEGQYCMVSGGAGVNNVVSDMIITMEIPGDGNMSFFGKISSENNWDYGYFYIDGQQMGAYTGAGNWAERTFPITAGEHTFRWSYQKDGSVNSNDDCFYVDYINFYKQPEPAIPGMTYDFDNSTMQGWTSIDADGDGYNWMVGGDVMGTGYGHNGSADLVLSQSYDNSWGALTPDNYLVSPQVQLGGVLRFYACAQDASYAAEHFGVAVSTSGNTNPADFTTIQEWTMSAKSVPAPKKAAVSAFTSAASAKGHSRNGNNRAQGEWYEFNVDLSAYSGMGYVAIRHFNCTDMFYLDVDDITIGEPSKGIAEAPTRSLNHYRVYRTNCYNDGPYTEENTVLLATVWVPDTVYIDVEWADLPAGIYKWGVGAVYAGNRGELYEAPITWAAPQAVNRVSGSFASMNGTVAGNHTGNAGVSNRDGWLVYDDGVNIDAIGLTGGGSFYWGVMFPAGSYTGNQLTKVSMYDATAHTGNIMIYQGGDTAPGTLVGTEAYTCTGSEDFTEWTLSTPVAIDPTENLWIVMNNTTGQYVAAYAAYCGDDNSQWISIDGTSWDGLYNATGGSLDGSWMIRAYLEDSGTPGPTPGTGNSNYLALPRESETIWSNCLDKDMWLEGLVTVNVLLNSADNPEGATVKFRNLNEGEQELYPMQTITIDETGYYIFEDGFRKGDYEVTVEKDGYETIVDNVSIWAPTDLRYVMIEIIYGVDNLYVSSTGWAMWDAMGNPDNPDNPNPPTPGDNAIVVLSTPTDIWGDGSGYQMFLDADHNVVGTLPTGNFGGSMPAETVAEFEYSIPENADGNVNGINVISAAGTNMGFVEVPAGTFDILTVNPDGSNVWVVGNGGQYTGLIDDIVLEAGKTYTFTIVGSSSVGDGLNLVVTDTRGQVVDMNDNGRSIYITDGRVGEANNGDDRHLEYFKVMCESIDHEPIFNANTVHPFCQVATDELVPGEHYICKVAAVYSTGQSAWSEVEWQYIPCTEYAGTVDGVDVNGNEISWTYPGGGDDPEPQPGDNAIVVLSTPTDIWGDGSGYQMFLDADHTVAVDLPTGNFGGSIPAETVAEFEYSIPENADGNINGQNVISAGGTNSGSVTVPAGTYDILTVNPDGSNVWVVGNGGQYTGIIDDIALEAGKTYTFTIVGSTSGDGLNLVVTDSRGRVIAMNNNGRSIRTTNDRFAEGAGVIRAILGATAYACNAYGGTNPTGWITFDVDNAGAGSVLNGGLSVFGGDYCPVDHLVYATYNDNSWKAFDPTTGAVANQGSLGMFFVDCAYDYTTNTMYGSYGGDLYTWDLQANTTSLVGNLGVQSMQMIAVDLQGQMYGVEYSTGNFYRIDKATGASTLVGATGHAAEYVQGGGFDHNTETLYWAGYNSAEGGFLASIDLTTGHATMLASNIGELLSFCIPYDGGVNPNPTPGDGNVLGAMIFADGEWEAFVPYPTNNYVYEGDAETLCVRMVYDGTNTLPEGNIYYSMSCEECVETNGACAAGLPIHAEAMTETDQVKVWWGEQPIIPGEGEWYYYDNGQNEDAIGTGGGQFWWGVKFPAGAYNGNMITKVAAYDYMAMTGNVTIYNDGANAPATAVGQMNVTMTGSEDFVEYEFAEPVIIDPTKNVWVVFYNQSGATYPAAVCANTGDANGRWVSLDGTTWEDMLDYDLNYTFMIRAYIATGRGEVSVISVDEPAGQGGTLAISGQGAKRAVRATRTGYNVYRATTATGDYSFIGWVEEDNSGYYEFIDTPETAGNYFYQVTAVYDNDCESEPAVAFDDPSVNYVSAIVTGISENKGEVALYPNPTSGNVKIEAQGMTHITVVSVLGQVVYDAAVSGNEYELNMGQYNAGVYMVRIATENGVSTQRVTVVK